MRREVTVQDGDDLESRTGRELYRDHYIGEIKVGRGAESLELRVPGAERWLQLGEAYGAVDRQAVQREMIRKVIREHLAKEKRFHPQGIKVLTLFFIDKVANYRDYDEDGNPVKGDIRAHVSRKNIVALGRRVRITSPCSRVYRSQRRLRSELTTDTFLS